MEQYKISLEPELYERLKRLAQKRGLSFSALVRMVLIEYAEKNDQGGNTGG